MLFRSSQRKMRLRTYADKVYPSSGLNSVETNTNFALFELASKELRHAKLPYYRNVEDDDDWISVRFFNMASIINSKIGTFIFGYHKLFFIFSLLSIIFTVCHLILISYYISKDYDNSSLAISLINLISLL